MTDYQWEKFDEFKNAFKKEVKKWQKKLKEYGPEVDVDDIIYNKDLDEIKRDSDIRLILVGDNPGKSEKSAGRYFTDRGRAGKSADGFLKIWIDSDWRNHTIVLNKTPIHTNSTDALEKLNKDQNSLLVQTQRWMAEKTAKLHCDLVMGADKGTEVPELWIVGNSHFGEKGIFSTYIRELRKTYQEKNEDVWTNHIYLFKHFSYSNFIKDVLNKKFVEDRIMLDRLHEIGLAHKASIDNSR